MFLLQSFVYSPIMHDYYIVTRYNIMWEGKEKKDSRENGEK